MFTLYTFHLIFLKMHYINYCITRLYKIRTLQTAKACHNYKTILQITVLNKRLERNAKLLVLLQHHCIQGCRPSLQTRWQISLRCTPAGNNRITFVSTLLITNNDAHVVTMSISLTYSITRGSGGGGHPAGLIAETLNFIIITPIQNTITYSTTTVNTWSVVTHFHILLLKEQRPIFIYFCKH